MKQRIFQSCSIVMLLCAASAHAQLYKWVGPDGKVTYSDTAPATSATRVETKSLTIGGVSASDFPYEVAEAMKNHPVTLYTSKDCLPCDDGRKLLSERGVPFTEKTVASGSDIAQYRQAGGDGQLPMLAVGKYRERGFEAAAWHNVLNTAGYPEKSKLPRSYRNPPAQAAAPAPVVAEKPSANESKAAARPSATELPPPTGNAPPGFRF
jgi:glutaredoxin